MLSKLVLPDVCVRFYESYDLDIVLEALPQKLSKLLETII